MAAAHSKNMVVKAVVLQWSYSYSFGKTWHWQKTRKKGEGWGDWPECLALRDVLVPVCTGWLLTSDHTPHIVTSKRNWRFRFLQSHSAEVNKLDGMESAVRFTKPATLAFQGFSGTSYRCKGNGSCFSAEYNLLHILHLISDWQNVGHKWNKALHPKLVTTEKFWF